MDFNQLKSITSSFTSTEKMPVLFLGHGSPMNAIEENIFVEGWRNIGKSIPKPNAIICISAHWETKGTKVTALQQPKTIHDFYGFPQALFDVQYPAPGSPELADEIKNLIKTSDVELDKMWGFDHGSWSVIKFLYPEADVPMIELSLDVYKTPKQHYELAKELNALRRKGVLIVGSGNVVHNLRAMDWHNPTGGFDWAIEANETFKEIVTSNDHQQLFNFFEKGPAFNMAVPSLEHYLPSIYSLALQEKDEEVTLFNDQLIYGSLGMLSFKIG
ncbi:4,5-DOPA dioxygenase extradiol [Algoriella sp.]|uniref:4,5-DOPA-extradiol-dioxygenase n=1 Tax=Algoriella sp. TaxID=1872434 RepID=UPI001B144FA4|nr:4,5-DOPA dioxygenase extradiol [Algoriella sp.]MBO6211576.1 4,5-DOPA dioxygenase extradiol [Algoriella sp.]